MPSHEYTKAEKQMIRAAECHPGHVITAETNITPVVFRWWQGSVIALFPAEHHHPNPNLCDSYQHVGQHGSANYHIIVWTSRPATPDEYASLKRELESAPYHYQLKVYRRFQSRWRT